MFWKRKKKSQNLPIIKYKSGEAFFEMQCKFGHTEIIPQQGIVALVLDSRSEFGAQDQIRVDEDGTQTASLKVASDDGGFVVISKTAGPRGDKLIPGDVVVWVPITHAMPDVPEAADLDERFGWVGFIIAKVIPEMDPSSDQLSIACRYD